ncbi:DUF2795 domain-containing protein [Actinomycetospora sp.]|uniref:DUF2795 domain-containing protein n=1 Tax=Actinomycetospora sp. TaxID=1872135 RepID=UPI002F3FA5DD
MVEAKLEAVRARLESILESVQFPTHRWQLVVAADYHGADHATRRALRDLSVETYPDSAAVVDALARTSWISLPCDPTTRHTPVDD